MIFQFLRPYFLSVKTDSVRTEDESDILTSYHVGDFHKSRNVVAFGLAQFIVNEFDGFGQFWYYDVFEHVYTSAGKLQFLSQKLCLFFFFCKLDEALDSSFEGTQSDVKLAAGGGKTVA